VSKVAPFHTTTSEIPAVYHDDDECADGKRIESQNRAAGKDDRRRCDECDRIAGQ
jgi:hypothetical protein